MMIKKEHKSEFDPRKVKRFLYYLARAQKRMEQRNNARENLKKQLQKVKEISIKKNKNLGEVIGVLKDLEYSINKVILAERNSSPLKKNDEDKIKIKKKINELEKRISDVLEKVEKKERNKEERKKKEEEADEKDVEIRIEHSHNHFKMKESNEVSEIEKLSEDLKRLEKTYNAEKKKKNANKEMLDKIRKRIELLKIKINHLKNKK